MKNALLKTLLHTLELAVVMVAVYAAVSILNLPLSPELSVLVVAAIVKFSRTHGAVPVPDYVNER